MSEELCFASESLDMISLLSSLSACDFTLLPFAFCLLPASLDAHYSK